jgi:signal peptidase I
MLRGYVEHMQTETKPQAQANRPASGPKKPVLPVENARQKNALRDIIEMVVLVAVIFLAIRLTVETHSIDGPSMQPNFFTNQSVITNKLAYLFGKPQRGDVLILHPPTAPTDFYIKRLIGLPGDTITLAPTYVAVNGQRLNEPYVAADDNCTIYVTAQIIENQSQCKTQTITLGADQYWVMGDNRPVSDDSRIFGPISFHAIVGKASLIVWPLSDFHAVNMFHNVFAHVPAPKHGSAQVMTVARAG